MVDRSREREREQRKMVLYSWPRMVLEVTGMRGKIMAPSLTLLSPLVLCNPDCTLWYLEIPVFQTKTFVWVTTLSPKM